MRYQLLEYGPDDSSTYPECWGSTATSHGRLVKEADRLIHLIETADQMGHTSWLVHDSHRGENITAQEFWKRPTVRTFRRKATAE